MKRKNLRTLLAGVMTAAMLIGILVVSAGAILLSGAAPGVRWAYLGGVLLVLSAAYVIFMKKNYHLHEEYLRARAAGIEDGGKNETKTDLC